jgi:Skp family chaperone for outer membrane proteins
MIRAGALVLLALMMGACSTGRQPAQPEPRTRCANIVLILEFMVRSDPDASALRAKIEEERSLFARLEKENATAKEGDRAGLAARVEDARSRVAELAADEEAQKKRLLSELNRALSAVASRLQVEYVMAAGDTLVYYRKELDITEDVIREIISQRKRNAPVAR